MSAPSGSTSASSVNRRRSRFASSRRRRASPTPISARSSEGLRRPSAEILQQIAKGLRISAEALYVQAGILEDRRPDSGVRAAVLADPELAERQKQVLLEIYESFRRETALNAEALPQTAADASVAGPTPRPQARPRSQARAASTGTRTPARGGPAQEHPQGAQAREHEPRPGHRTAPATGTGGGAALGATPSPTGPMKAPAPKQAGAQRKRALPHVQAREGEI